MKETGFVLSEGSIKISYEHNRNGFDADIVIVCPGFFNSKDNQWLQKTAEVFARSYDTIVFDFRGHGESEGKFSWSAYEYKDLVAVYEFVRRKGYRNIAILGYSLGAAAAVNAVSLGLAVKSMILVSGPASFWEINYHFWEPEMFSDLKDNIECNWEGKGARVDSLFIPKPKPVDNIREIKDSAILFVHGDRDWIIKSYHARMLYDAASAAEKEIKLVSGGLHAERMLQQFPQEISEIYLGWLEKTFRG